MLIYLHIPFCDSKCYYCAFNSYVDKFELKNRYMQAIVKQLEAELLLFKPLKKSIKSLFIGGGTPSTIKPALYEDFFKLLNPYLKNDAEITIEANPNSASSKWLEGMKNLGVNRISFGVQSFDDKKLKFLGRNHNKKTALQAISNAKKAGFENISLDLIYGTTKDSKTLLLKDLKTAKSLPINHLSAYSLTIEENTDFFKTPNVAKDSLSLAKFFTKEIESLNFPSYEISNFGIYQSVHNLGYWAQNDYIGIGSGAVGFLKDKRFYPAKEIESYMQDPTYKEVENLSKEALHIESVFLGLRCKLGVKLANFNKRELEKIKILLESNKLVKKDDRIYNTDYFLSDELALFITD
ncbi:MAG: radical SAM family heme chaperone HemW [Sulfurospirillum sp.]